MIENLMQLVSQYTGNAAQSNPNIPADKHQDIALAASDSIESGLQQMLSQGGIKDVLRLFNGNETQIANSSVTSGITDLFVKNLAGKGVGQQQASGLANIIPGILSSLVSKSKDPNDSSFDVQGLFNSLSGGQTSGLNVQDLLSKLQGGALDLDGDGDTDLNDLMLLFSKGGQGGAGGILNAVKGFFKK